MKKEKNLKPYANSRKMRFGASVFNITLKPLLLAVSIVLQATATRKKAKSMAKG